MAHHGTISAAVKELLPQNTSLFGQGLRGVLGPERLAEVRGDEPFQRMGAERTGHRGLRSGSSLRSPPPTVRPSPLELDPAAGSR
jgi:hypothetical protein